MNNNNQELTNNNTGSYELSYDYSFDYYDSYYKEHNENDSKVRVAETSSSAALDFDNKVATKGKIYSLDKRDFYISLTSKMVTLLFVIVLMLLSYLLPHYLLNASLLDILSLNYKLDFLSNLDYKNYVHFVFIKDFCGTLVKCLPAIGLFSFLAIPYIFFYEDKTIFATLIDAFIGGGILSGEICYVFFNSYIYREFEDCRNSIACYAISASILFIGAIVIYHLVAIKTNNKVPSMILCSLIAPVSFSIITLLFALIFGTIAYLFYNFSLQIGIIIILSILGCVVFGPSAITVVVSPLGFIVDIFCC